MKKYQIIGGQYESKWYGESNTLRGARRIANQNKEYWDNWQGWNRPRIYAAEDVQEFEANGLITIPDGCIVRVPAAWAIPIE